MRDQGLAFPAEDSGYGRREIEQAADLLLAALLAPIMRGEPASSHRGGGKSPS